MTAREIIEKYLKDNGYGGLYDGTDGGEPCGCHLGDLMPCGEASALDCSAGYKKKLTKKMAKEAEWGELEVGDWFITPEKK